MMKVVRLLQEESLDKLLLIEDITTNKLHTAIRFYPEYPNRIVIHVKDVSRAVNVLTELFGESKDV